MSPIASGLPDSTRDTALFGMLSYLNPFFDYSSIFQPAIWQNALRWCHTPDTYIETADGWITPISELQLGDVVWTSEGWQRVVNIFTRDVEDIDVIELRVAGLPPLVLTADHALCMTYSPEDIIHSCSAIDVVPGVYLVSICRQDSSPVQDESPILARIDHTLGSQNIDDLKQLYEELLENPDLVSNTIDDLRSNYAFKLLMERLGLRVDFSTGAAVILPETDSIFQDIVFGRKYIYRKVHAVIPRKYTGRLYSITVENAYNYIANGLLVRNCEYIVSSNGILRSALKRVISFFITDIIVDGVDRHARKEYYDYLITELKLVDFLRANSMDFITYGNVFVSLIVPFIRVLHCTSCGGSSIAQNFPFNSKLTYSGDRFHGVCPLCGRSTSFTHNDMLIRSGKNVKLKRWNIFEMMLEYDLYSENYRLIWKIPAEYKNAIKNGDILPVSNADINVLRAIDKDGDILLNNDEVFFGKDDALVGLRLRGWGLSRIFSIIRAAWYFQSLHRANEAIALDYTIPLRILTPVSRPGVEGVDPLGNIGMASFVQRLAAILDARRRDPNLWHISPYPIDYKTIGGDGRVFAPRDLFEAAVDILLSSADVPVDFYKGTMTMQAAPLGLRIMESMWADMFQLNNRLLKWLSAKLISALKWERTTVIKLAEPRHIDDINRQMAKIQLMMSGAIAKSDVLRSFGIDLEDDTRRRMEEQVMELEESEKIKKELEGKEMGSMMAGGAQDGMFGAPMPGGVMGAPMPGGSAPMIGDPVEQILARVPPANQIQNLDPRELDQYAASLAQTLFQAPATVRNSALRNLKIRNETMWMLVKEKLNDMVAAARRSGIMSAQQGAAPGGMPF